MNDKVFIDTNIFIYAWMTDGSNKHAEAKTYLEKQSREIVVSTQIMNELYAVLLKYNCSDVWIQENLKKLYADVDVVPIAFPLVEKAWDIRVRLHYSLWDSLVIAAALESDCSVLCTEDLQHGQVIDKRLRIINPFLSE